MAQSLTIRAPKQGLLDITNEIARWVAHASVTMELLTLFLRHTSASILIQKMPVPMCSRIWRIYSPISRPRITASIAISRKGSTTCPPKSRKKFRPGGPHAGAFGPKTACGHQSPSRK